MKVSKTIFVTTLAVILTGCAATSLPTNRVAAQPVNEAPAPEQTVQIGQQIATGEQIQLNDAGGYGMLNAVVGQNYRSALGQECYWIKAQGSKFDRESIALCRDQNDEWQLAPHIWSQAK